MNKSGLVKDAITLTIITLVCGLILGYVYGITKDPIATQEKETEQAAYKAVMADADSFENTDALDKAVAGSEKLLADQDLGNNGVTIGYALNATKDGETIGYVIDSVSHNGYGGDIEITVGINTDGTIQGIEILSIDETVGLGMNAKNKPEWRTQYYGKKVEWFTVTKTGSTDDSEIDALSGATITSKAFTNAVDGALYFYNHGIVGGQ